jgi:hypothetical protein
MLLVRAGLSEDESDRFLERLGDDLHAGKLEDQDARLKFIEAELAQIQDWQHAQPKPPSDVRIAVVAVITGLFTNALYDIVKGPAIRVADDLFAAQSEDEVAEVYSGRMGRFAITQTKSRGRTNVDNRATNP